MGPSAAGPTATTPAAVVGNSSATSPTGTAGSARAGAVSAATGATTGGQDSPSSVQSATAGLTSEQTRTRSATVAPAPRPPRSFCGGGLVFGAVADCGLIIGQAEDTWTFTSKADSDILYVQVAERAGVSLSIRVKHRDGWTACDLSAYHEYLEQCRLGTAGTYTLGVRITSGSGKGGYSVSIESRRTPSTCEPLPEEAFSWASTGVAGSLPAGLAARCYTFDQPIGSKLFIASPQLSHLTRLHAAIADARHQTICQNHYDDVDCTLDSAGPYRIFVDHIDGAAAAYHLRLPRISQPVGCSAMSPAGDLGQVVGQGRLEPKQRACHSFTSTTAGRTQIVVDQQVYWWRLYDHAGGFLCNQSSADSCALPAAGSYTLLVWSGNDYKARDYQVTVTPPTA